MLIDIGRSDRYTLLVMSNAKRLSNTMRALVLRANGTLEVTDVPLPEPVSDRDVLVRVRAAGVCGSDLPRAFGGGAYHYPLVMGHEIAGVVEAVPPECEYRPGDRVVVFPLIPCRACSACAIGAFAQCEDYDYLGSRRDGGFAEYVSVPAWNLFRVPDRLDLAAAALTEPVAVALHGVGKLSVTPGETAAVFGGGPIGLLVAHWLRIRGCSRVFVVEVDGKKLRIACDLGFDAIDGMKSDPVETIRAATGGGVSCAVEACGLPATYRQSLEVVSTFGQVVLLGNLKGGLDLPEAVVSSVLRRELTISGSWNSSVVPAGMNEWTTSLDFLDREINCKPLISHRITLEEAPELFEAMWKRELSHMRVVVLP